MRVGWVAHDVPDVKNHSIIYLQDPGLYNTWIGEMKRLTNCEIRPGSCMIDSEI